MRHRASLAAPLRAFSVAAALWSAPSGRAFAAPEPGVAVGHLGVELAPVPGNPAAPKMGDRVLFHSTVRNAGTAPVDGVVAWFGLVQVDPGQEQPVDLEDWGAHKAVAVARLVPGEALETDWPVRLIQAGHYRVVVSAASRDGGPLSPSPFVELAVRRKPVVESARVLPVALGVPALLLVGLLLRHRAGRGRAA